MRQAFDNEFRKDLIVARECSRHREEFVVRVKHHANEQEQRKLKQHYEATQNDRLLAVFLILAREQSLHEKLVCAVRSHRQEGAAKYSGPKCERQSKVPT